MLAIQAIGFSTSQIVYIIFFWFFSNEIAYVSYFGFALSIFTTILAYFIPESPRLLCAKGQVCQLKKCINTMAWFNRKVVTWTDQELKWIEDNGKSAANASK